MSAFLYLLPDLKHRASVAGWSWSVHHTAGDIDVASLLQTLLSNLKGVAIIKTGPYPQTYAA